MYFGRGCRDLIQRIMYTATDDMHDYIHICVKRETELAIKGLGFDSHNLQKGLANFLFHTAIVHHVVMGTWLNKANSIGVTTSALICALHQDNTMKSKG